MQVKDGAALLCGLPPFVMLVCALIFLKNWMRDSKRKLPEQLLVLALGVFAAALFFRFFFTVPETLKTYAPGRWADLDYFGEFIRQKAEGVKKLMTMEKTSPDQTLLQPVYRVFFLAPATLICFFLGWCRLKPGAYFRRLLTLYPESAEKGGARL